MIKYLAIAICCVLLLPSLMHAQDPTSKETATNNPIVDELEAEIASLEAAYNQKVALLDSVYVEKVKALRDDATARLKEMQKNAAPNDLDEAIRLRDLAKEILDRPFAPPSKVTTATEESKLDAASADSFKAERKKLLARISELEKQLGLQSELSKKVAGSSYRIQISNNMRVWTFAPNGALVNDGKVTATRWSAFGNDAVICVGYDNGNIDICQFSNDFKNIEVIYAGNYKNSRTHHLGIIVTK